MLNPHAYFNSRPDGFPVLEIASIADGPRPFAPLKRTELTGTVTGPLAALTLTQTFLLAGDPESPPVEALYRFPLPGDAAVTGVTVRFADVEIRTALKERAAAAAEYAAAKGQGRQAALLTRESPDVFTLTVAGLRPGQEVQVRTEYVHLARPEGNRWALRVPLTTAPRYVREDEARSRHAAGQPLAVLRDPGHRFALNLTVRGAAGVQSPSHPLASETADGGVRVRLAAGEVLPDRDCVLHLVPAAEARTTLRVWAEPDAAAGQLYFLALATPPAGAAVTVPREVILLVDHSGSMGGAKWDAADWAVEKFLGGLTDRDAFALAVFHNDTRWLVPQPVAATAASVKDAVQLLKAARDEGGTELGVALEQALGRNRTAGERARHVLVVTDAEVTDAGRLLRLADAERARPDGRRVSVLCIDAAPNAAVATALADRGGGAARFLTSNPAENDVTTALDEVLAEWAAPAASGVALDVNRPTADADGLMVSVRVPGPAAAIDVGDLPAGRPAWVAGRVPLAGPAAAFRLTRGADVLAEAAAETGGVPGVKALFGAGRVRRLEHVQTAGYNADDLKTELARLGLEPPQKPAATVYDENARVDVHEFLKTVIVAESLAHGVPSAETAFVAARTEAGRPVEATLIVANAAPHGWLDSGPARYRMAPRRAPVLRSLGVGQIDFCASLPSGWDDDVRPAPPPPQATTARDSGVVGGVLKAVTDTLRKFTAPRVEASVGVEVPDATPGFRVAVVKGQYPAAAGAVLYDSVRDAGRYMLPPDGCLTAVQLSGVAAAGPNLALLIFVGADAEPRGRVRLTDLVSGTRRPLNLLWRAGEAVRVVLDDPAGEWPAGVPPLELGLAYGR